MSNFSYCPLVWMFSNATSLKKLKTYQKRALRFLSKTTSYHMKNSGTHLGEGQRGLDPILEQIYEKRFNQFNKLKNPLKRDLKNIVKMRF